MANCKMFGGLFKPKFYKKCKAAIKLTKTRLETIKRKREAVLKFLKNDIADLLKNDLDYNAYGRVEGLFIEQNITRCYKLIEEFCECVLVNLSNMLKQSECPEECREAVASLAFSAARFADLPELRDLRSLFYDRYGKSIDNFVNKEFASRVRPGHPAKETKMQLMRDVALEFSIEWDSKTLEQKLFTQLQLPTSQKTVQSTDETREEEEKDYMQARVRWNIEEKQISDNLRKTENKFGVGNPKESRNAFRHDLSSSETSSSQETVDIEDDIPSPPMSENVENKENPNFGENLENKKTSFRPETAVREDEFVETEKKPNSYKNIPPPYRKEPKLESSSKPKPQSVRQRRPRPLQETTVDDEEKCLDGLLRHYSSKKSPNEVEEPTYSWWWKGSKASEADLPKKAISQELEKTTMEDDEMTGHRRASSLGQSEMSGGGHVHPKLPEYDELAARITELRRSGET